jgi:hypothetical protein
MYSDAQHRAKHHARKRAVTSMSTIVMRRKLKRAQVRVEDSSRMLLFLSEKNVPRLKQFVARRLKNKMSVKRLVMELEEAYEKGKW